MSEDFEGDGPTRSRPRRGAKDGGDRIARIARWLSANLKPSAQVECLLLTAIAGGEESEVLGRWERGEVNQELAYHINGLIVDCANDKGTTISALLAWVRADGSTYLSKGFRATCEEAEREIVRPMDGTIPSIMSGMQRHNEAFAAQLASFGQRIMERDDRHDQRVERMLQHQERTIDKLLEKLDHTEELIEALKLSESKALQLADVAAEAAEDAEKRADEAEAGKDDPLGKVVEIGIKQLMGGQK